MGETCGQHKGLVERIEHDHAETMENFRVLFRKLEEMTVAFSGSVNGETPGVHVRLHETKRDLDEVTRRVGALEQASVVGSAERRRSVLSVCERVVSWAAIGVLAWVLTKARGE